MKRSALILCLLGVAFLIVGSVMAAVPSLEGNSHVITSSGTVVFRPDEPQAEKQSEQASYQTPIDQIGYLTILLSAGFLSVGLLINRKRN